MNVELLLKVREHLIDHPEGLDHRKACIADRVRKFAGLSSQPNAGYSDMRDHTAIVLEWL